jgi:hypothetical protein
MSKLGINVMAGYRCQTESWDFSVPTVSMGIENAINKSSGQSAISCSSGSIMYRVQMVMWKKKWVVRSGYNDP